MTEVMNRRIINAEDVIAAQVHARRLESLLGHVVKIEIGQGQHGPLAEIVATLRKCDECYTGHLWQDCHNDDDEPGWTEEASFLFAVEDVTSIGDELDLNGHAVIRLGEKL